MSDMEPWYNEEKQPLLVRLIAHAKCHYLWYAAVAVVLLLICNDCSFSYYVVSILIFGYLSVLNKKLDISNRELINLNEKFAVNQRKISKSIKDHTDLVSNILIEQKELFDSIVKPPKKDKN